MPTSAVAATTPRPFEFKGVVRLTKLGSGHLIFTLLLGFAAINTGNNSLYIGLAFMLGSLILSGLASKEGLKQIEVEFSRAEEAWVGRPSWGTVKVTNRSRIWNVRDVVITALELDSPVLIPVVARRSSIEVEGRFLFRRRGHIHFTTVDLYTRYPFGLFVKKRKTAMRGEKVVYPRLLDSRQEPPRLGGVEGDLAMTGRPGSGSEIHAFRDYVRGDSLRDLYWKKSASLGRWIVKQMELETGRSIIVAFDPIAPPSVSDDEFELLVSEATTLIQDTFELGLDVQLIIPPATLKARDGNGREQILEALALVERSSTGPMTLFEPGTFIFSFRRVDATRSA